MLHISTGLGLEVQEASAGKMTEADRGFEHGSLDEAVAQPLWVPEKVSPFPCRKTKPPASAAGGLAGSGPPSVLGSSLHPDTPGMPAAVLRKEFGTPCPYHLNTPYIIFDLRACQIRSSLLASCGIIIQSRPQFFFCPHLPQAHPTSNYPLISSQEALNRRTLV